MERELASVPALQRPGRLLDAYHALCAVVQLLMPLVPHRAAVAVTA
jgi:hypothetical protein